MAHYFNVAGPCNAAKHYMIEASSRLTGITELINQEQYFVIHAARQSGKTTFLLDLANRINREGKYYALYCSLEGVQGIIDPKEGIPAVVRRIEKALRFSNIPNVNFAKDADYNDYTGVLATELTVLSMSLDKPLVIFFDEADCLSEGTLISFLRQLRSGYTMRFQVPFVHSIIFAGTRNICDFSTRCRPESQGLADATLFGNISKILSIKNFTQEEIMSLYRQHTTETGQIFEPEAIEMVYQLSQGQPWLVNAIACEVIEKMLQSDYSKLVTAELVDKAIQTISQNRNDWR
ncbi:hypothetical protein AGMMS4956_16290 [Bacteroidia bacterium]|nr:hypothetical protein AGMMS4956_16290 [Bacteroidia bacterium]